MSDFSVGHRHHHAFACAKCAFVEVDGSLGILHRQIWRNSVKALWNVINSSFHNTSTFAQPGRPVPMGKRPHLNFAFDRLRETTLFRSRLCSHGTLRTVILRCPV